ncbi:ARM repeat superfamily protein [Heracleum sosnowskyi]|uniref:ARM repeat superfamily protein n=1 Tax=Heracleum sosnowskyi TaxID=360622 RepID=A0AAD8MPA7_9APIA|nr:ARM repeat superfamily protein [Heracleum sosnowskyi]
MELIPAASAMEWSIELEKSLRSKNRGKNSVQTILEFGSKLDWWSGEPKLTTAQYDFFGLFPGEDNFYANAIVFRLIDAFSCCDNYTKLCIVKVFKSEYKRRVKRRNERGILSRERFCNYLEVLRRVKMVFEKGDVEVRSLCLGLFGCLADYAHDNAEIRYVILSSLVSGDVMEVKASLFAAGCFSELSEDFACVVLEMVVNLIQSADVPNDVRIAGVRCLGKLGRSYTLAIKAYEASLKVFFNSSEEDLSVALMISLSKIAVKSRLLTSTHVKVLFSFLSQDRSSTLQATSLKCMRYILARGVHYVEASTDAIRTLSCTLSESTNPPALQCDALQILHKIVILNVFSFPYSDIFELLSELLTIVENNTQSSTLSYRVLYVLVDMYCKFMERADSKVDGEGLHHIESRMITSITNRIFAVKENLEVKSLISLLLHLVHARTVLAGLVLEKIINSVKLMSKGKRTLSHHGSELGEMKRVKTKAILYVCKALTSCLEKLDKTDALTTEIHATMKLLVEDAHRYNFFDCNTRIVLALLYMSYFTYHRLWNNIQDTGNLSKLGTSDQRDFVQLGISTLNCSNEILTRMDNWLAYKAGKSAACHGTWFVAAFIFRKLIKLAQSHSCVSWLNLLADFAHSEMHIQFLTFPKQCSDLLNCLESRGISTSTLGSPNHIDNLVNACKILHSSVGRLNIISRSDTAFSFQHWFLSLRARVLENVVDMFRLLNTISDAKDGSNQHTNEVNMVENSQCSQTLNSLVDHLTQISMKFRRLAQELDLVTVSFIGMDNKSVLIISALALSCSLLAFSVGFVLYTPNIEAIKCLPHFGSAKCKDSLDPMLLLDLFSRLWHVDREISSKLMLLLDACGLLRSSYIAQPRNHILDDCYETRSLVTLCGFAVGQAVGLQNDANRVHDNTILPQLATDGLHLLLNITKEWMQIPFQTPSYFFRIRSPVSSQIFISNKEARHGDGLSVFRGSHLSLNLCLQLRNMPQDLSSRLPKLYCVLSTSALLQTPCPIRGDTKQPELGFQDWRTDDMIDMNKKLFQYVIEHKSKISRHGSDDSGDCRNREALVCFETNMKGQGFSTCLLDVSDFPVGSYRIKWHSCGIDSQGVYWSLLPSNPGPIFTVK